MPLLPQPRLATLEWANTFWNDCCRFAVGSTRVQAHRRGLRLTDIRQSLSVQSLDYYLRHRVLSWLGKMSRMDQARLPLRLLTSNAVEDKTVHAVVPQPPPRPPAGDPSPATMAVAVVASAGATAANAARTVVMKVATAEAASTLRRIAAERAALVAEAARSAAAAQKASATALATTAAHTQLSTRARAATAAAAAAASQVAQVAATAASAAVVAASTPVSPVAMSGRRWSVGHCLGACKCTNTRQVMTPGQLRFTKAPPAHGLPGHYPQHYAVTGMVAMLENDSTLQGALEACLPGLDALTVEAERVAVVTVTSSRTYELLAEHRARMAGPIAAPAATPWNCPRCDKLYRSRVHAAVAHAEEGMCTRKRLRVPIPAAPAPLPPPTGRRRPNLTWTRRVATLLRGDVNIPHTPYLGCNACNRGRGRICDPCLVVEALKVARSDQPLWDTVTYGVINQTTAQAARRRSKHRAPEGQWVDPRLGIHPPRCPSSATGATGAGQTHGIGAGGSNGGGAWGSPANSRGGASTGMAGSAPPTQTTATTTAGSPRAGTSAVAASVPTTATAAAAGPSAASARTLVYVPTTGL